MRLQFFKRTAQKNCLAEFDPALIFEDCFVNIRDMVNKKNYLLILTQRFFQKLVLGSIRTIIFPAPLWLEKMMCSLKEAK